MVGVEAAEAEVERAAAAVVAAVAAEVASKPRNLVKPRPLHPVNQPLQRRPRLLAAAVVVEGLAEAGGDRVCLPAITASEFTRPERKPPQRFAFKRTREFKSPRRIARSGLTM